jgi:predicted RNase H-like nuclease (RuvC/YqgF family)
MAPGKVGAGSEADKIGSKDLRQRKLVTEDNVSGKKVTFKMTGAEEERSDWKEFRAEWLKEVKDLKVEVKKLRKLVERAKNRESEWEKRFRGMRERLDNVERQNAEIRELMNEGESGEGEGSSKSGGSWRTHARK